jgi:ABC-type antimicrobial peptide transport system permease subunit
MVVQMGARLLAGGLVIGFLVSLGASRLIASQLWGVSAGDPLTLIAVLGVLFLTGLVACYMPARKATGVDPLIALRRD